MTTALLMIIIMGAVIFFCRIFPFLIIREDAGKASWFTALLNFVERAAPPVAMTVLAFNAVSASLRTAVFEDSLFQSGVPVVMATIFTALLHLWKRNSLISIFGGIALYMGLKRLLSS
jgi:branched-subunit amino acid transport protein AzlD